MNDCNPSKANNFFASCKPSQDTPKLPLNHRQINLRGDRGRGLSALERGFGNTGGVRSAIAVAIVRLGCHSSNSCGSPVTWIGLKLVCKCCSSNLKEMGRIGAAPTAGESRALGCKGDRAMEFIRGHFGERPRARCGPWRAERPEVQLGSCRPHRSYRRPPPAASQLRSLPHACARPARRECRG